MTSWLFSVYIKYQTTERFDVFEFRGYIKADTEREAIAKGLRKVSNAMDQYHVYDLLMEAQHEDTTQITYGVMKSSLDQETNVEVFRNRAGGMHYREEIAVGDHIEPDSFSEEIYKRMTKKIKGYSEVEEYKPRKVIQIPLIFAEIKAELSANVEEKGTVKRFLKYDETVREPPTYYALLQTIEENPMSSKLQIAQKLQGKGYYTSMKTDSLRRRIQGLQLEKKGIVTKDFIKRKGVTYQKLSLSVKGRTIKNKLW